MPIYKVVLQKNSTSNWDRVNAAYFKQNEGWIEFKNSKHELVKAYAPGTIQSVEVTAAPDGTVVFDMTWTLPELWRVLRKEFGDGLIKGLTELSEYLNAQEEEARKTASI